MTRIEQLLLLHYWYNTYSFPPAAGWTTSTDPESLVFSNPSTVRTVLTDRRARIRFFFVEHIMHHVIANTVKRPITTIHSFRWRGNPIVVAAAAGNSYSPTRRPAIATSRLAHTCTTRTIQKPNKERIILK